MRRSLMAACAAALLTTGCASQLGAFFNRPVVEDNIKERISTVSLSADRRTIVVATSNDKHPMFCAEPPPDTATGLKTDWEGTLKVKGDEASLKDKLETSVTVLSARNAPLDAFRTGLFSLCQFYMNGALSQADVKPLFEKLIETYKVTQPVGTAQAAAVTAAAKAAPSAASGGASR
jgi:hypothetical protein